MPKRILLAAGGTGGHVYPAQGLAQQLARCAAGHETLFVAAGLHANRYFDRSFSYQEVESSPLLSKNPIKVARAAFRLSKGVWQSIKILKSYQPNVVVGFGSYHTLPVLLAAKWLNIPIVLHEANSVPGKVNKWFAPYADRVGVHFPFTLSLIRGNAVEVGMPLREGYTRIDAMRPEAKQYFQLDAQLSTLLIFGGSQGAEAINVLMRQYLKVFKNCPFQVIHLTGNETATNEFNLLYANHKVKAYVKTFEKRMDLAWQAADLFLGRSGASTIAEAMEFEVPGILIPYPYATDNHQEKNADFLTTVIKGGTKFLEKELTPECLEMTLTHLLKDPYLNHMKQAMQAYKKRPFKIDLCQLVLEVADLSIARE